MKFRKNKKGFTIVELIIVIAVIGILTAVMVPTIVHLVNKANKASDESLVSNLNKAVALRQAETGKAPVTMFETVEGLREYGYNVDALVAKSDEALLYDLNGNKFYLEGSSEVDSANPLKYWKVQSSVESGQKYNIYAMDNFSFGSVTSINVGFDAGNSSVANVNYVDDSNPGHEVLIRTNSPKTSLNIDAKYGTIHHYDEVGRVTIEKIDMNCYYEKGSASYVKITEGKVVAKDGGTIDVAFAANNDGDKVAIIEEEGEVKTGYTIVQPVADSNAARVGGIELEYSIDGEHAASATEEEIEAAAVAIEETGELSVASQTGIMPEGMDYAAVVNNRGYDSLVEAFNAANAGETVSLLKDALVNSKMNTETISYTTSSTLTVGAALVVSKNLTINGNSHTISTASKGTCNKGVSIAIVNSDIELVLKNVSLSTNEMSNVYVGENAENVKLFVLDSSLTVTSGYGYSIKTCNGSDNFYLEIKNSSVDAWATVNTRSSNSKFLIKDCSLTGENRAAAADSNDYATICIDGDGCISNKKPFPHYGNPGVCGSNNEMVIENCTISATSQSTNSQCWLCIQYGAQNNKVSVTGGDIKSAKPWSYTEEESGLTNSVKVDGVAQVGELE